MATNILEEANEVTSGDRQKAYGPPQECVEHIAAIASAISKKKVTYKDVLVVLVSLKLAREMNKHKRDNLTDLAGYAWVWSKCEGEE